jgi:hypothetical protein
VSYIAEAANSARRLSASKSPVMKSK